MDEVVMKAGINSVIAGVKLSAHRKPTSRFSGEADCLAKKMHKMFMSLLLVLSMPITAFAGGFETVGGVDFYTTSSPNFYTAKLQDDEWWESDAKYRPSEMKHPFGGQYEKLQEFVSNNQSDYAILIFYQYFESMGSPLAQGFCDALNTDVNTITSYAYEYDQPVLLIVVPVSSEGELREQLKTSPDFLDSLSQLDKNAPREFLKKQNRFEGTFDDGSINEDNIYKTNLGVSSFFVGYMPDGKKRVMSFWKEDVAPPLSALRREVSDKTYLGLVMKRQFSILASHPVFGSVLKGKSETFAQKGALNLMTELYAYFRDRGVSVKVSEWASDPSYPTLRDGASYYEQLIDYNLATTAWSCDFRKENKYFENERAKDAAYNERLRAELAAIQTGSQCMSDTVLDIAGHISCP